MPSKRESILVAIATTLVGTISKGGEYDPETGEVITSPTVISGWHVNYSGEPPEKWEAYAVFPQNPVRVWA